MDDALLRVKSLFSGHQTYLACYLVGLLVSYLLTPLVILQARRMGAVDKPLHRKVHREPTPMMGGLAIFFGTWIPLLLLSFHDNRITQKLGEGSNGVKLLLIFVAGAAMLLVGLRDDLKGMNARRKFLFQLPIAIGLVAAGVRFEVVQVPGLGVVDLGFFGSVLSVIWIVGITNALNLIDGIDGLATGIAFFVAGTNAIVALINGNVVMALVMWSMAGACLGFLRYNFAPAKIFLGDTGSLFLGVTLAVTAIQSSAKGAVATSMLIPVVVLGYPALDTLLAMARRVLRGKSMFSGDREHIHHRLLQRGLDHGRAAVILYLVCLLFCMLGIAVVVGNDFWIGAGVVGIAVVFLLGLWLLGYLAYFTRASIRERPMFKMAHFFTKLTLERFGIVRTREEVYEMLRDAVGELGVMGLRIHQEEGPWGPAYQAEWLLDRESRLGLGLRAAAHCANWKLKSETYTFEKIKLSVTVSFCECNSLERNELCDEFRNLAHEVVEGAHLRLREIAGIQSSIQEALSSGIRVALGSAITPAVKPPKPDRGAQRGE